MSRGRFVLVIDFAIVGCRLAANSTRFYTIDASASWRQVQERTEPISFGDQGGRHPIELKLNGDDEVIQLRYHFVRLRHSLRE